MSDSVSTTLTIWASHKDPGRGQSEVCLWQDFLPEDAPTCWFSLPGLIDGQWETLRERYGEWLNNLGQTAIRGRSASDRLLIRPGLSFWWMALPCTYALDIDSPVYRSVRMMVLDDRVREGDWTAIRLVGGDRSLVRLVRRWAGRRGLVFSHSDDNENPKKNAGLLSSLHGAIPPLGAALVALRALPRVRPKASQQPRAAGLTVVGYTSTTDNGAQGYLPSVTRYWGPLPELLEEFGDPLTWLYVGMDPAAESNNELSSTILGCESGSTVNQHVLLRHQIGIADYLRSLGDYLSIAFRAWRVARSLSHYVQDPGSAAMWDALEHSRRIFLWGTEALSSCLWVNVWESTLVGAPKQRIGLYLFENQPWEKALIHAWRAGGHGELIGVSHTTMLDWDTRYFPGRSALASANTPSGMPLPDHVAVNGPLMRAAATLGGYDEELLIDVEALRFPAAERLHQPQGGADGPLQLLVLGEYIDLANTDMLTVVVGALVGLECETRFRPHPARPESAENLPTGLVKDVSETLEHALEWADIVICGPFSTASLDAVLDGRRTIVAANPQAFSCDPLHGYSSSPRCTSSNELILILSSPTVSAEWNNTSMVTFNRRLDSWRELVAGSQLPSETTNASSSAKAGRDLSVTNESSLLNESRSD